MAYIGQSIKNGTFSVLDTSGNTYNGSNTAFALGTQVGSPAQLLVSHDGVIQKPGTDYTLSSGGAAITFSTAPASGAAIFIVEISGAVGGPMNTDINGAEFILDVDGDTSITADTDDQIDFKTGGSNRLTVTSTDITANTGNIVFGTSGKGIHLGVTSATASNLLDDYEFGTWTPALANFTTSGTVTTVGRYVKAGRMVTASGTMAAATSIAHDSSALIQGFPFAGPVTDFGTGSFTHHSITGGNDEGILLCDLVSSRIFFPSSFATTSSNQKVSFTVTYEAAS